MKGRKEGFASFRDTLAKEMGKVFPEMKNEIEMVVESTGGKKGFLGDSLVTDPGAGTS